MNTKEKTPTTTQSEIPIYKDFMCRCSIEEKQKCLQEVEQVCKELQCKQEVMITYIVAALQDLDDECDTFAAIENIDCDQWCRVSGKVKTIEDNQIKTVARISVQCDRVEDGIARFYSLAKQADQDYQTNGEK